MATPRIEIYKAKNVQLSVNPQKFLMWLFLITVAMLFAAFTSALVVSKADAVKNSVWESFHIPTIFAINTVVIALSSITLHWAYISAKKNNIDNNRYGLILTLILGIIFIVLQVEGYQQLTEGGIHLTGDTVDFNGRKIPMLSGSFFYVISGMHALHVIGGIFFIIATIISAYRFRIHSRSMLRMNLLATYWHFIGAMWLYLFAVLTVFS